MKKLFYILCLILVSGLISCTDVIDVELQEEDPRLVVEASIDWKKGTAGNQQRIKLSLSTPYYENLNEVIVTGAAVRVINNSDQTSVVFVDQNDGFYTTDEFVPVMLQTYTLEIIYDDEVYLAQEVMTPVPVIDEVFQSTENGFDKNALEVNVRWRDPADVDNYYLSRFQRRGDLLQTLFDVDDEFTNGNYITRIYEKFTDEDTGEKEFQPGDIVDIALHGISQQYFNYIRILIEQGGGTGPFSTIPAEIKGNCINTSNKANYAFGYFRLTEVDERVYEFQ